MSSYVKRSNGDREGWTGPIRSEKQAQKEAAAWTDAGWTAEVVPSTPEVRSAVRAWMNDRPRRLGILS